MAYRVVSEFAHRILVGVPRRRADCTLTSNAAIAGTVLASVSLIAAGTALFGHGHGFDARPDVAARAGTLRIALVDPAPPQVVRRDPRIAIATPGPHRARIAVATVPLPRARPARMATIASERVAEKPREPGTAPEATANAATPGASIQHRRPEVAAAPVVPLPAARPVQLASIAPAPTAADARGADPQTTGSLGKQAQEPAAASPQPVRKRTAVSDKPARKSVLASLFKPARTPFDKLYGPVRLASLTPADTGREDDSSPLRAPYDRHTAVYVISARKVYLPDGRVLEAHSGLGNKMDDPRFVRVRMRGATPPHMYDLSLRESLFHGVEAIRLTPLGGGDAIFGRSGLLAHTYMLGPSGQSYGCVSFRNYDAFLRAYKSGEITRLAVIARLD